MVDLINAVREQADIHRGIDRYTGYFNGFPQGLISDTLEWPDLEIFENEETEDDGESEEGETQQSAE